MEIIGLIAISLVLMLFKGGIAGVIMLWLYVIWAAWRNEKKKEQIRENFKRFKEEQIRKGGYISPQNDSLLPGPPDYGNVFSLVVIAIIVIGILIWIGKDSLV